MDMKRKIAELIAHRDAAPAVSERTSVNFKITKSTHEIIKAGAKNLGTSCHKLGGEMLEETILSLFNHLPKEDQLNIATKSDEITGNTYWTDLHLKNYPETIN